MTRVDGYLFKNSLKMILKLLESPSLDEEAKSKIKDEITIMLQVIDRFSTKQ